MTICAWFVLCENEAVGTVAHPVLGSVPTCQRCADKLDLKFETDDDAPGAFGPGYVFNPAVFGNE